MSEQADRGYTSTQVAGFLEHIQQLRNETAGVQMLLHDLSGHLTQPRACTFANEGIGRRLGVVARCVLNIFELFPPDTKTLLTNDDCNDVAIQVQAFAINVYAIFDNIAWVCMLEAGGNVPPMQVGVFKKACQPFIPAELATYLAQPTAKTWFDNYGKVYRDSTAHRIPPYLPSRVYTPEEGKRFKELHALSQSTVLEASNVMRSDRRRALALLDQLPVIDAEKNALGSNSLLFALSLTAEDATPPVYLHPQLLCDWALVNEVLRTFDRSLRADCGWPARELPRIHIG